MAIVDPNKSGDGFRSCGKGKKVLAVVGFDKRKNQKGNFQYEVHYICLKDLAAPAGQTGDKGADHWDRFVLVENALFRIGQVMKAAGHTTPFDTDDAQLIADTLSAWYLVADVKGRMYEGEERFETKGWEPYTGGEEADWADLIKKGEENHKKLVASRAKGAGGGGGGAAPSNGGTAQRRKVKAEDDPTATDDDGDGPLF